MRGRTNASNGGIFLNATTDDFEVATGNTIVAGDFVEYHYDTAEKELLGDVNVNVPNYLVDASTNLYLTLLNSLPTLFTIDGDDITIVSTYPYNAGYLLKYSDTIFICSTYILEVDVENQEIDVLTQNPYSLSAKYDDGIFVGFTNTSITFYDYSDLNNISILKSNTITNRSASFVTVCNKKIYTVYGTPAPSTSQSTVYGYMYLYSYTIDQTTYEVTNEKTNEIIHSSYVGSRYRSPSFDFLCRPTLDDRYFIFTYRFGDLDSTSRYYLVWDSVQEVQLAKSYLSSFTGITYSSSFDGNGYIILSNYASTQIYLYKLNTEQRLFTKIDDHTFTSSAQKYGQIFMYPNRKYSLHRNSYYTVVRNVSDEIVEGEPTDTVKEWAGSGNPLGVAKQSGTAGDTIQVYVPTVNS